METKQKIQTGTILLTNGVNDLMNKNESFLSFCTQCLKRHKNGDWGDMPEEDKENNDFAISNNQRIFSGYIIPDEIKKDDDKIWIITEWDRSSTTILFPSEY